MKLDTVLDNFFIINTSLGSKEGEEKEKILWYFPDSDKVDKRVRNVGFAEAVVRFTSSFKTEICPDYTVETDYTLQVYLEAEPDYIVGMTVSKTKCNEEKVCIHPSMFAEILRCAYRMFRLFFGSFHSNFTAPDMLHALREKLDYFYSRYLSSLKLSAIPLMDVYNGINFMPLDQPNYLKVQSIVSRLCETFPIIKQTVFLYNDKVLWYSVPRDDMCILFRYLCHNLLPVYLRQELEPSPKSPGRNFSLPAGQHYGKYIIGPSNLDNPNDLGKVPDVYLGTPSSDGETGELARYKLVVYRSSNATMCLMVDAEAELTYDVYKSIDIYLGPLLVPLSTAIADTYAKLIVPSNMQYVYFNHETKSIRSTLDAATVPSGNEDRHSFDSMHVWQLLCDIQIELAQSNYFGDVVVKTAADFWIAGKKFGEREVLVLANQKSSTLADVTDEVKKICSEQFSNMFLLD